MAKIPTFATDQEEAEFWDTHDSTDFLDELTPVDVTFIDTRPRKTLISLRLDSEVIAQLKVTAYQRGIGYQTLIRIWVMERLASELGRTYMPTIESSEKKERATRATE